MARDLFGELMAVDEAEKREAKRVRNRKLRENVPEDLGSRKDDLEVVGILVDTSRRSVAVDRSTENKNFVRKPQTVGYKIQNISENPVQMERRVYERGDNPSVYVCKDVEYVLMPGENVILSKYDAARLFGRSCFGFKAANGYFTGAKGFNDSADLETFYSTRYFVPSIAMSDRAMQMVNSQVGLRDVREDLLPIFAYLLGGKKPKRQRVASRCEMESLALADFLNKQSGEIAKVESSGFAGGYDEDGILDKSTDDDEDWMDETDDVELDELDDVADEDEEE